MKIHEFALMVGLNRGSSTSSNENIMRTIVAVAISIVLHIILATVVALPVIAMAIETGDIAASMSIAAL